MEDVQKQGEGPIPKIRMANPIFVKNDISEEVSIFPTNFSKKPDSPRLLLQKMAFLKWQLNSNSPRLLDISSRTAFSAW